MEPRINKHRYQVVTLLCIVILIAITNYHPGTWLMGWDNLLPEFDFLLNIKRSLFAVWQEYQGPGLLGGMGHAAALPRELILWILSLIIPSSFLRYTWTYLMLFIGVIGAYALGHRVFKGNRFTAFFVGLFYLTNLATIQIFRAPFEAFITHYAALPWLLWAAIRALDSHNRKSWFVYAILSFIFSTQAYIPTLFLVYAIVLFIVCLHRMDIRKTAVLLALTILTNAYWLLPAAYFTLTKSSVTVEAKINQMATNEVFLRNQKFGTITDTLLLRNFWFDNTEYNPQKGLVEPIMEEWISHTNSLPVVLLQIALCTLILSGGIVSFASKRMRIWGILAAAGFAMIANDSPPFSWIMDYLRAYIPLLSQFFRFPFTKWGAELALSYAMLLGISVTEILRLLTYQKRHRIFVLILSVVIILITLPMFTGHLFSERVRLSFPDEYTAAMRYLRTKSLGRMAILPQQTYWDWKYYDWNNVGSGFLWYGIEQPVMDRAFDVWSAQNENYYWELSAALYSKDAERLENVFRKYDVKYILLDENVVSPSNNRSLFIDETKELLGVPTQTFGKLSLYERKGASFVHITSLLPKVNPYTWTDNDVAYRELGDYIEGNDLVYQYRSLFTKRSVDERKFDAKQLIDENNLVYDSTTTTDIYPQAVKECGLLKNGSISATTDNDSLQFTSLNQRGCLSFNIPNLEHKNGYLVEVEYRHITGRPLILSVINETAKHTELETYLSTDTNWRTDYFILPPLAPDGLGYNPYFSNDSIGRHKSVNELRSIKIYTIPYEELVHMKIGEIAASPSVPRDDITVEHPNPAYYKISNISGKTLILSQSYDQGWLAYDTTNRKFLDHVLVNNWENGWTLMGGKTVYIFFWPQLLEFLGFALLPIPFVWACLPAQAGKRKLNR